MGFESFESGAVNTYNPADSVSTALLGDTWKPTDIRNAPQQREAPEQQGPQQERQQDMPPAPTQEQINAMNQAAENGRLNETAANLMVRGMIANGPGGLSEVRNNLNTHLENQNSDYRARIARVDGPNGEINFYMVLQRNGENLNDIVRDVHRNGRDSQYSGRAVHMQLQPQRQADI